MCTCHREGRREEGAGELTRRALSLAPASSWMEEGSSAAEVDGGGGARGRAMEEEGSSAARRSTRGWAVEEEEEAEVAVEAVARRRRFLNRGRGREAWHGGGDFWSEEIERRAGPRVSHWWPCYRW